MQNLLINSFLCLAVFFISEIAMMKLAGNSKKKVVTAARVVLSNPKCQVLRK